MDKAPVAWSLADRRPLSVAGACNGVDRRTRGGAERAVQRRDRHGVVYRVSGHKPTPVTIRKTR